MHGYGYRGLGRAFAAAFVGGRNFYGVGVSACVKAGNFDFEAVGHFSSRKVPRISVVNCLHVVGSRSCNQGFCFAVNHGKRRSGCGVRFCNRPFCVVSRVFFKTFSRDVFVAFCVEPAFELKAGKFRIFDGRYNVVRRAALRRAVRRGVALFFVEGYGVRLHVGKQRVHLQNSCYDVEILIPAGKNLTRRNFVLKGFRIRSGCRLAVFNVVGGNDFAVHDEVDAEKLNFPYSENLRAVCKVPKVFDEGRAACGFAPAQKTVALASDVRGLCRSRHFDALGFSGAVVEIEDNGRIGFVVVIRARGVGNVGFMTRRHRQCDEHNQNQTYQKRCSFFHFNSP